MRSLAPIAAAALLAAAPAAAQQPRGFTLEEVEDLLHEQVASDRVLELAQRRCIHFAPDKAAMARVAAAGGSEELVAGLSAPGQCTTLAPARAPAPVAAPPRPAAEPAPQARRPFRGEGAFVVGYHRNGFHLDGDEADDVGNGMALELAAGSRHVMLFLRGDAADTSPESGPRYDSGHADFGVRLFLLPPGMAVRPYADAAVTYADVSFFDPETDDIGRTLTGGGWSYAGGVVLGGANVGLDLSYRTTAVHFDEMEVDGETALLPEPFRGRTTRVVVGLRISRVYR